MTPEKFRNEVNTRLIATPELADLLGLKSRQALKYRVKVGLVPQPIYQRTTVDLFDIKEVLDKATLTPTDKATIQRWINSNTPTREI